MITEDYVSFEVAKLLKEKGFDEKINTYYLIHLDGFYELFHKKDEFPDPKDIWLKCPTHQMALKWLREVHKLHFEILYRANRYEVFIMTIEELPKCEGRGITNNTYEEAVEAAIKYCLTNLIK